MENPIVPIVLSFLPLVWFGWLSAFFSYFFRFRIDRGEAYPVGVSRSCSPCYIFIGCGLLDGAKPKHLSYLWNKNMFIEGGFCEQDRSYHLV